MVCSRPRRADGFKLSPMSAMPDPLRHLPNDPSDRRMRRAWGDAGWRRFDNGDWMPTTACLMRNVNGDFDAQVRVDSLDPARGRPGRRAGASS